MTTLVKFVSLCPSGYWHFMMSNVPNDREILYQLKLFSLVFSVELNTVNCCVTNAVVIFCLRCTMRYILHITEITFKLLMPNPLLLWVLATVILLWNHLFPLKLLDYLYSLLLLEDLLKPCGSHDCKLYSTLKSILLMVNISHLFLVSSCTPDIHFGAPSLGSSFSDHIESKHAYTTH